MPRCLASPSGRCHVADACSAEIRSLRPPDFVGGKLVRVLGAISSVRKVDKAAWRQALPPLDGRLPPRAASGSRNPRSSRWAKVNTDVLAGYSSTRSAPTGLVGAGQRSNRGRISPTGGAARSHRGPAKPCELFLSGVIRRAGVLHVTVDHQRRVSASEGGALSRDGRSITAEGLRRQAHRADRLAPSSRCLGQSPTGPLARG